MVIKIYSHAELDSGSQFLLYSNTETLKQVQGDREKRIKN
jgi:16S rRNA G1207 methylase RsmC